MMTVFLVRAEARLWRDFLCGAPRLFLPCAGGGGMAAVVQGREGCSWPEGFPGVLSVLNAMLLQAEKGVGGTRVENGF